MYAKQVLWEAVDALATSDGSIQARLAIAAGSRGPGLIKIADRLDEQLPEEHREEFRAIWRELTKEGSIAASTTKLSTEEAEKIAERILGLFTEIMGGL